MRNKIQKEYDKLKRIFHPLGRKKVGLKHNSGMQGLWKLVISLVNQHWFFFFPPLSTLPLHTIYFTYTAWTWFMQQKEKEGNLREQRKHNHLKKFWAVRKREKEELVWHKDLFIWIFIYTQAKEKKNRADPSMKFLLQDHYPNFYSVASSTTCTQYIHRWLELHSSCILHSLQAHPGKESRWHSSTWDRVSGPELFCESH